MSHAHAADPIGVAPLTLMWFGMMAAMMAPTVWPWVRSFHRFGPGHASVRASSLAGTVQFAAGYLVAWLGYSIVAALAQRTLQSGATLDHAAVIISAPISAIVFLVAGLYQFAPLKRACLTHCRSPFGYFLARWRNGPTGGFRMGIDHGLYCVGCCWALMATTLAVGVMSVWWMIALAVVALVEQVAPGGDRLRRRLGAALIVAAVWLLCAPLVRAQTPESVAGDRRSTASTAGTSTGDAWPGWRGLAAQGRSDHRLPTHWSADSGIRWKTPIPGRGHSSPIVFGNSVYVTTAYTAASGALLESALHLLTLGLLLVLGVAALRVADDRCHPERSPTTRDRVAAAAILTITLVLAILGAFGGALFDLARSTMRGWMLSTAFVSLCLAPAAIAIDRRSIRLLIALGALAFAGFTFVAFPSSHYAFRGGVLSLRMQVAIAASALPLVVGVTVAAMSSARRVPIAVRRVGVTAVVVAAIAGVAALVRHVLVFRDESIPETVYQPYLSVWLPLLTAAVAVACSTRRIRATWLGANLAVALASAGTLVLAVAVAIEQLASRSPYLAYQLATPALAPQPGGVMLGALSAGLLLNTWWGLARPKNGRGNGRGNDSVVRAGHTGTALASTALVLGVTFFLSTNYAGARSTIVRALVSVDRESGRVRWTLRGLEGPQAPIDGRNSPATPTAVTDGRIVCGYFGSAGLLCADPNGGLRWSRTDLAYEGSYGVGFSPILVRDLVVLARDLPSGTAVVDALDAETGSTRWTRTFETTPTFSGNSRTPIVVDVNGEPTIVLWGMKTVTAVALGSGKTVWEYPYTSSGDLVASAIADGGRLYLSDVTGTIALDIDDLAAGRDPVRWRNKARSSCASPVVVNGILFTVTDAGIATGIRADSGATVWRERLPGQYFASLIASPDAVYFTNSEGLTTVVGTSDGPPIVAQNSVGEETLASMAAGDGELFIRSTEHLYAVGGR
jgi:predicted metal-binding membrane protein/outer membrane protein assembly factor BamB